MIFTFTKMQTSVKRTGMIDVVYFEDTFSVRKDGGSNTFQIKLDRRICLPRSLAETSFLLNRLGQLEHSVTWK